MHEHPDHDLVLILVVVHPELVAERGSDAAE
jgi:hypothetical protein